VKIINSISRAITNPLGAAVICVVGGCAIWFAQTPPGGAAKPNARRELGIGQRSSRADQSGQREHRSATASKAHEGQRTRHQRGAIAATKTRDASQETAIGRNDVHSKVFEAENEPLSTSDKATAAEIANPRLTMTEAETTTDPASDVIGPRDPRSPALTEFQTKKTGAPDTAVDQRRLALWCDQNGLWELARTHWEASLRLDPKSDEARRRLGHRLNGRDWVLDATSAEDVAQKKANAFWRKELEKYHARMKCRSKVAVPGRDAAVASVEAVGDPRAATSIWKVFAADASHHALMVGILTRFKTREASQMLAALAVYSRDAKAQAAAVAALQRRRAADYGERLVSLMHNPMRIGERLVPIPGSSPARELMVEGDTANYQFFFSRLEAPTSASLEGCFQPRLSAGEIAMARQFNENQAATARKALDQQVELAKQMIKKYNDSIRALNDRVARVLNEACNARINAAPESGRRWLALALGTEYKPPTNGPKQTITEIVSPLYSPTFLPIPVAT
jgi:hypothetical protein